MLQQKPCSRNVEIPGGRGGHQSPPWNGNSEGVGGCKPKTFRRRGMDIFWNHTIPGLDYMQLSSSFLVFLTNILGSLGNQANPANLSSLTHVISPTIKSVI